MYSVENAVGVGEEFKVPVVHRHHHHFRCRYYPWCGSLLKQLMDVHVLLFILCFQDYMTRYGYLTQPDPREGTLLSTEDITFAVKNLQHVAGLKETGSLQDPETVALVDKKRCAVPDFGPTDNARRKRRYATHGTVWHKKVRGQYSFILISNMFCR